MRYAKRRDTLHQFLCRRWGVNVRKMNAASIAAGYCANFADADDRGKMMTCLFRLRRM